MMQQLIETGIQNLGDFIEKALTKYGEKPAFSCLGQTVSFSDLEEQSRSLACWLQQSSGLQAGDRIVIQLPNIIQYPIAAFAALRAGLIVVNTNPLYTPKEMAHQFKDSGAKAIIILKDLLPKLEAVKSNTDIKTVITCNATDLITQDKTPVDGCYNLNQIIEDGASLSLNARTNSQLDDTCVLQYTGGTTGVSKGAQLSHRNIISNTAQFSERIIGEKSKDGEEIYICPLPLYHIYAFTSNMIGILSRGNLNVLIPNPGDMPAFVQAIKPYKFTGFVGINTLFVGLCMNPEFKKLDFSQLNATFSGGAALTSNAAKMWKEVTGNSISEGYGLSETAPGLCCNKPGFEQMGTVGPALIGTDIQIWNDENQVLAQGEEGEIVVKGPQVMKAYWNRPDETQKAIVNGYFKTGDVGKILDNGFLKIVDRLKDMIIVSGFNVYPNEVEDVLTGHPNILEAAVVSQPDDKTGECVCAYVVVNKTLSAKNVVDYCRGGLTGYKVPKRVFFLDELPKSSVGKILRKDLRTREVDAIA